MGSYKEIMHLRALRVRNHLKKVSCDRLRLSVYRSNKNIYVQIIDDLKNHTIVSASTLDPDVKLITKKGSNCYAANVVGKFIAERAEKIGIKKVFFDRGAYIYHGRIKALAEAARKGGLNF